MRSLVLAIIAVSFLVPQLVRSEELRQMDYLGNSPEYYQSLIASFNEALASELKPLALADSARIKGGWKLEGYKWDDHDTYEFDGIETVRGSKSYQYYRIPANGILSLYYHYAAMPEYGVTEDGYAEEAFYAHWVDENTIHVSNSDSSLQWLLKKQP